MVPPGWVSNEQFLAGYGAAEAVPGPLFTFAAYLGAATGPRPNGWAGGGFALIAIFLPSFLLVVGALPFWDDLRARAQFQAPRRAEIARPPVGAGNPHVVSEDCAVNEGALVKSGAIKSGGDRRADWSRPRLRAP